jgi:NADPH-dependent curcumin reductase CurA
MGVEAIGEVIAVGSAVQKFSPGDPVGVVQVGGAYRHVQRCKASNAVIVPNLLPEALAIVPSAVSALVALEQVGEMGSNQLMCITAAAGGLGNALTQLALMAGNRVIAVCGSDEKARWLKSLGVERVVQYRREDLGAVLAADYPDQLDLVMDSVGGETFDALLPQLAPHGKLVVCGYSSDRLPTQQIKNERVYTSLYWKAASVRGFMNYRYAEFAADARQRLFQWWQEGRWTPRVDAQEFRGLGSVAGAGEWLLAGENLGKVVVDLRGSR